MAATETETHRLAPDGGLPNNDKPLLVHRGALGGADRSAEGCAALFRRNGWQGTWLNGVFSYWHYHARSHEALGCISGSARIGFGGDGGIETTFAAGDVVIIPAGVGHRRLSSTPDFRVVGCYPPGQDGAISRPDEAADQAAIEAANAVPAPATDPVHGASGGLTSIWR